MKKSKIWISINSLFAFVSAFIFVKGVISISRFIVIRHFDGSTQMINFEMLCITWEYSPIWTTTSVITIYFTALFTALGLVVVSSLLYNKFRTVRGLVKLWLVWFYVVAVNQSIGLFLRDIPFKRDLFHAFNWMYIPYGVMIAMTVLTIPALYFTNIGNDIKFLRLAPSYDDILSNRRRRKFYTRIALIPSILGSIVLLSLHLGRIELFEITELLVLIVSICFSYILFFKDDLIVEFRIVKNEPSNKLNVFVMIMLFMSVAMFYYFSMTYY